MRISYQIDSVYLIVDTYSICIQGKMENGRFKKMFEKLEIALGLYQKVVTEISLNNLGVYKIYLLAIVSQTSFLRGATHI